MTESEFDYLMAILRGESVNMITRPYRSIEEKGWVYTEQGHIDGLTDAGREALKPYKVDNAVIMAAGRSRRCMPLSNYLPKGLFEIKGETMVERQIKQLHDAGLDNAHIIIVAGYLKEQYHKMAEKYPGLIVLDNDEWEEKNNLWSLWVAREYLRNTYVCCSDNWFAHNVFRPYVWDSYYACKYTDNFCDEYCVKKLDSDGYMERVKKGGEKAWYTIGEAYFNAEFSRKFVSLLEGELYDPELKYMLWDDFQIRHITELKMRIKKYDDAECKEFDTNEDILRFYPQFKDFIEQYFQEVDAAMEDSKERLEYLSNYADTRQYSVVPTEQITGRLHVNENLFGPSPKCMEVLKAATVEDLCQYDLMREDMLTAAISRHTGLPSDNILVHSGSSDVIKTVMTIALNKGDTVLLSAPAWNYYKSVVELRMARAAYYNVVPGDGEHRDEYVFDVALLMREAARRTPRVIVITTPHNPTGAVMKSEDVERVVRGNPRSLVIVDEAYMGFSDTEYDVKRLLHNYSNVVFTRTFSKLYALAGMRVGYALCTPMARQVFHLDVNPFRICNISRKLCVAALEDREYYTALKAQVIKVREDFRAGLNRIAGIHAYRSYANFVYVRFDSYDVQALKEELQRHGILVRLWTETSRLSMRITIGPQEVMDNVLHIIEEFCGGAS